MNISFHQRGFEEYQEWATTDKKGFAKLNGLIKEILRTPYEGTGQPEPLKGDLSGFWSRRINQEDRIVYQVVNDTVTIVSCKYHY